MESQSELEAKLAPINPENKRKCLNRIKLNENINWRNFIGCLCHYFMLSFVFVSVDSLQPMLLQQNFKIERQESVENFRNALVISFDILVKILCAPVFGYFADRKGRAMINFYGIICIGLSMMMMPYCPSFETYILVRCFYATGAIAISVVPLLADYVSQESRGTCAAILVFMSSIGAVSSAFINFTILKNIEGTAKIHMQYGVVSIIILVVGILYTLICIKKGNSYYLRGENKKKSSKELITVLQKTLKNPELSTGYLSAFLARSDSILLSLYLVLWVFSFYEKKDDSVFSDASSKASALSGITYTIIMLSCIIYGFIYERKNISKRNIMIVMLIFAFVGSALMNFSSEINGILTYAALSILGIGMSGLLTSSLYLVNEYSTPEHRGYITGIQTIFGVVGIIFQTLIGAVLYEFVSKSGPFAYFSLICLLGIIFTIFIYKKVSNKTNELSIAEEGETITNKISLIE